MSGTTSNNVNDQDTSQEPAESVSDYITLAVRSARTAGMAHTPFIQLVQAIWHSESGEPFGVLPGKDKQ